MTRPTASTARVTAGVAALALLGGCGADRHARDDLPLTPQQEHDVFLASDNLGPDTDVIVLANVPKARYENGAIVLTGGKQLYVVQPHAWRTYTGTALSAEEAQREVARAERLDVAIKDIAAAATELKQYLEGRSSEAAHASARLQEEDAARHSGQEAQQQRLLEEAARLHRARDQEIGRITASRDDQVAAVYKEGGGEIEAISGSNTIAVADAGKLSFENHHLGVGGAIGLSFRPWTWVRVGAEQGVQHDDWRTRGGEPQPGFTGMTLTQAPLLGVAEFTPLDGLHLTGWAGRELSGGRGLDGHDRLVVGGALVYVF